MVYSKYLNFLHPNTKKLIHFFYYRSRYLIFYILIGVISIIFELQIRSFLIKFSIDQFQSSIISLVVSITAAFFLNIKFNFKIQKKN